MKELKFSLLSILTAAIVALAIIGLFKVSKIVNNNATEQDSTKMELTEKITAIEFKTVDEALITQGQMVLDFRTDSVFRNMRIDVLENVVKVCLNKYQKTNPEQIVEEYYRSKDIYDAITPPKRNIIKDKEIPDSALKANPELCEE